MSSKRSSSPGRLKEVRVAPGDQARDAYPFHHPRHRRAGPPGDRSGRHLLRGRERQRQVTLVEAIAIGAGLNAEGGSRNPTFATRPSESDLHRSLELVWGRRPSDAFFLRAETFHSTATAYEGVQVGGLHERSHGESFLDAFWGARPLVRPGAFVVLDEPESALSVTGQLKLMRAFSDLVAAGSQFLVATHSPVLLAYPEATIYELGPDGIGPVTYEETQAYLLTRSFLEAPERFLRHLFAEEGAVPED